VPEGIQVSQPAKDMRPVGIQSFGVALAVRPHGFNFTEVSSGCEQGHAFTETTYEKSSQARCLAIKKTKPANQSKVTDKPGDQMVGAVNKAAKSNDGSPNRIAALLRDCRRSPGRIGE
jgi:hypothetical protein